MRRIRICIQDGAARPPWAAPPVAAFSFPAFVFPPHRLAFPLRPARRSAAAARLLPHPAGAGRVRVLAAVGAWRRRVPGHPARDGGHGAAGLSRHHGLARARRGCRRGAGGHGHRGSRDPVRLPRPPHAGVAAAASAGHAGLRHGLCVHRFPAVQRPAAGLAARHLRSGGPAAARGAQPGRGGVGVRLLALSVRLSAGAHGARRARRPPHGGRTPAGCAARAPRAHRGAAAGASRRGGGRGPGADGDAGGFRGRELFRHPDLHDGHLQGLAVDGQPPRRGAARHAAAGAGGRAAAAGAARAAAHALCHQRRGPRGLRRGPAPAARRLALRGRLAGVRAAGGDGLLRAGGLHAAPAGRGLVRAALGPLRGMGRPQCAAGRHHRGAGRGRGAGAGLRRAAPRGSP